MLSVSKILGVSGPCDNKVAAAAAAAPAAGAADAAAVQPDTLVEKAKDDKARIVTHDDIAREIARINASLGIMTTSESAPASTSSNNNNNFEFKIPRSVYTGSSSTVLASKRSQLSIEPAAQTKRREIVSSSSSSFDDGGGVVSKREEERRELEAAASKLSGEAHEKFGAGVRQGLNMHAALQYTKGAGVEHMASAIHSMHVSGDAEKAERDTNILKRMIKSDLSVAYAKNESLSDVSEKRRQISAALDSVLSSEHPVNDHREARLAIIGTHNDLASMEHHDSLEDPEHLPALQLFAENVGTDKCVISTQMGNTEPLVAFRYVPSSSEISFDKDWPKNMAQLGFSKEDMHAALHASHRFLKQAELID